MKNPVSITLKCAGKTLAGIAAVILIFSVSPVYDFEKPHPFEGPDIFDPYAGTDSLTEWKRANFHTHTRVKGLFNECPEWPDSVYEDYRRLGYDILTFSNHNRLTLHPYDTALQVNVYEHGYNPFKFHKLVFGADKVTLFDHLLPLFPFQKQWQLDILGKKADLIVLNHPDRTFNVTGRCMSRLTGYRIMEGDSGVDTEFRHLDEALDAGHYAFALTSDDCHDSDASWCTGVRCCWVDTPSGQYGDLRDALARGRFYSMRIPDFGNGDWTAKYAGNAKLPRIESIGVRNDTIYLELSRKASLITFTGQGHVVLAESRDSDSFAYAMAPEDHYARITAFFNDGCVIYTQPFARYDKACAVSPYRVSPHPVNVGLTILYNLLVIGLAVACIRFLSHKKDKAGTAVN